MKWQKYQYFQKWPKLCAIPQDFASLCTVDLAIVYEQGFVYYVYGQGFVWGQLRALSSRNFITLSQHVILRVSQTPPFHG